MSFDRRMLLAGLSASALAPSAVRAATTTDNPGTAGGVPTRQYFWGNAGVIPAGTKVEVMPEMHEIAWGHGRYLTHAQVDLLTDEDGKEELVLAYYGFSR